MMDRSIIANVDNTPKQQMIVTTLARSAERSGAELVAQYVSTEEERASLNRLGIGYMHGPIFGPPISRGAISMKLAA